MSNYYQQFNIRPHLNASCQAHHASSNLNNLNFYNRAPETIRPLSPAVAHANPQMYNASYAPIMAAAMPNFSLVDQTEFAPMYMMNTHPGMTVMPTVSFNLGNQPLRVCHPTNCPEAADLLGQCATENKALLQNQIPTLPSEAVYTAQTSNLPTFPRVSVTQTQVLENAATLPSADVHIPFRQVQWIPPPAEETAVPLIPYAVEIKPQEDEIPQNPVPLDDFPMISTTVPENGTSCRMEFAKDQSVATAYLVTAAGSSLHSFDASTRTPDETSVVGGTELSVTNVSEKTGQQKRSQSYEHSSGVKVLKLCDEKNSKPCSYVYASSVHLDSTHRHHKSNGRIDEFCAASDQELNEPEVGTHPMPVQENDEELLHTCSQDAPLLSPTVSEASEPDELINSDENVEDEDVPDDGNTCSQNEDVDSEAECYEVVPTNSDALLFDMECDGGKEGKTLRVIAPTKNVQTSARTENVKTVVIKIRAAKTVSAPLKAVESILLQQPAATLRSTMSVPTIYPKSARSTDPGVGYFGVSSCVRLERRTASQRSAARACKDKISAVFDMERSDEIDDEASCVMPAENSNTDCASSLPETTESQRPHQRQSVSCSSVIPVCLGKDDSDVTVVPQLEHSTANTAVTTSERFNTEAYNDKISSVSQESSSPDDELLCTTAVPPTLPTASDSDSIPISKDKTLPAQTQLQTVKIKRSENSLLGLPLHSVSFHFESWSSEVFPLLWVEKSYVPQKMLMLLTDLLSLPGAAAQQCSHCNLPGPFGKFLFQCLFCPYGESSAKRVVQHVMQRHQKYAALMQRSLLTVCEPQLRIYCHHCDFVTHDSAALLIHFATYHKVLGIFSASRKLTENDPTWTPVVNPDDAARHFPFYCCPDCSYLDVEWNRFIQHMLKKHSSKLVFFGCVVRLIKVGSGGAQYLGSSTYNAFATEEMHASIRKEIYACVKCRFSSFYPSYVFRHYAVRHSCLEMLYLCAASPCCPKRCTTTDDIISHIGEVHVAVRSMQFRCTATLFDRSTSMQLDVSPGELTAADVPVHSDCQSPSAACSSTSSEASPVMVIDVDDDSDD